MSSCSIAIILVFFLVFFLAFVIRTLVSDGFAVNPDTQEVYMQPYKYLHQLYRNAGSVWLYS